MEFDPATDSVLAALGNISAHDLEEILDIDMPMLSQATDVMGQNRQTLPSQLSEHQENNDLSDLFNDLESELIPNFCNKSDTSLLVMTTQDQPLITIDDSRATEELQEDHENCEGAATSAVQNYNSLLETLPENYAESTFELEFARFKSGDFDIPQLDEDYILTQVSHANPSQSLTPLAERELISHTQIEPIHIKHSAADNVYATCPNLSTRHKPAARASSPSSEDTENYAHNFLALDYSASSSKNNYVTSECMQFSDVVPSQASNQQSLESHASNQEPLDFSLRSNELDISCAVATSNDAENIANKNTENSVENQVKNSFATDPTGIPLSVKQLYDLMKANYSDFALIYALSAQLCQDRVPMSCFVNVKMALLLSIASIGHNPDIPPIPIIIMGNDSYMANYLISSIADLAARFVGPIDDVKPPSTDGYRNRIWIEADPIQLAKGGVYYAGDWSCLKAPRSEKIFKDIENSRVAHERTTQIYPLQTAIWAHWRSFKYTAKDQQIFNKFVKIFGIPICLDDSNHEALVDYMLKQASVDLFESTVDHLSISSNDMRKFLAVISARTVDLTSEAIELLQKYFVASRLERPDCLTKQAFVMLKRFAESFAKLSLRHEVLIIDAIGAIYLCEHFIQHVYGAGARPPPVLEAGNFVGNIDQYIAKFYEWSQVYIVKYDDKQE